MGDHQEVFRNANPRLALAECLHHPFGHEIDSSAFLGNPEVPVETIDMSDVSLDYLVEELEKGRQFGVVFRTDPKALMFVDTLVSKA